MTEAIGTQKTVLPSSVIQALLATSPKFSMPFRSFSAARLPSWNSLSEMSNGRQVIRSPAVPPWSLEFSAALYSVGAVGWNWTLMFGYLAWNAGMIFSSQIDLSSLRQLSIVSVTCSPEAAGAAVASDAAGAVVAAGAAGAAVGCAAGGALWPQAAISSARTTTRLCRVILRMILPLHYNLRESVAGEA